MRAMGAYISELCVARGMSDMDVVIEARRLFPNMRREALNQNYVGRLENWNGKTSPEFDQCVAIIMALGGNFEHVAELLRNEEATVDYARRLARAWTELVNDREAIAALNKELGPDAVLEAVSDDKATDVASPISGFFLWWRARKRQK